MKLTVIPLISLHLFLSSTTHAVPILSDHAVENLQSRSTPSISTSDDTSPALIASRPSLSPSIERVPALGRVHALRGIEDQPGIAPADVDLLRQISMLSSRREMLRLFTVVEGFLFRYNRIARSFEEGDLKQQLEQSRKYYEPDHVHHLVSYWHQISVKASQERVSADDQRSLRNEGGVVNSEISKALRSQRDDLQDHSGFDWQLTGDLLRWDLRLIQIAYDHTKREGRRAICESVFDFLHVFKKALENKQLAKGNQNPITQLQEESRGRKNLKTLLELWKGVIPLLDFVYDPEVILNLRLRRNYVHYYIKIYSDKYVANKGQSNSESSKGKNPASSSQGTSPSRGESSSKGGEGHASGRQGGSSRDGGDVGEAVVVGAQVGCFLEALCS